MDGEKEWYPGMYLEGVSGTEGCGRAMRKSTWKGVMNARVSLGRAVGT